MNLNSKYYINRLEWKYILFNYDESLSIQFRVSNIRTGATILKKLKVGLTDKLMRLYKLMGVIDIVFNKTQFFSGIHVPVPSTWT